MNGNLKRKNVEFFFKKIGFLMTADNKEKEPLKNIGTRY